ncbi:hypothetical protein L6452_09807 [Arctium lappa]|uniref:Uncharacterized protein n=1 Tax=Arctium lappa TaxID=4217 RepID=A0ACB9DL07_ARCLA|nr:hypothetical protein L6452_09807 [Arctium lappa]
MKHFCLLKSLSFVCFMLLANELENPLNYLFLISLCAELLKKYLLISVRYVLLLIYLNLFGPNLTLEAIVAAGKPLKETLTGKPTQGLISASMGNLTHYTGSGSADNAPSVVGTDLDFPGDTPDHNAAADGYASEDFVAASSSSRVPWTEEEHRMFLLGLQKLGKDD